MQCRLEGCSDTVVAARMREVRDAILFCVVAVFAELAAEWAEDLWSVVVVAG